MSRPQHPQIKPLTGLRAIAALWVVLVHVEIAHPVRSPYWADLLLGSYGTLPVVFFFLLSGFILSVVYVPRLEGKLRCKVSLRNYAWSRFARIIPVYIASILPALGILVWRLLSEHEEIDWLYGGFFIRYNQAGGSVVDYLLRANIPAWSLIAEVLFYSLFPFFLRRIFDWDVRKLWKGLALCLGIYLGLQSLLVLGYYNLPGWWSAFAHGVSHFGPPTFVPIFVAGMILGLLYHRDAVPKVTTQHSGTMYLMLALVILGSAMYRTAELPVSMVSAILAPVFCLVIFAGTSDKGFFNKLMSTSWMQALGTASYSIYITHWPLRDMLLPALKQTPLAQWPIVLGWVLILILVGLGYLAYLWIERPLQKWVTQRTHRSEPDGESRTDSTSSSPQSRP